MYISKPTWPRKPRSMWFICIHPNFILYGTWKLGAEDHYWMWPLGFLGFLRNWGYMDSGFGTWWTNCPQIETKALNAGFGIKHASKSGWLVSTSNTGDATKKHGGESKEYHSITFQINGFICTHNIYIYICIYIYTIEGSLEVKLPTIWTNEKQRWKESERREEWKREDQRRERVRRKKMQMREKVGKSRYTLFFQWFVAPEGRKVGLLKRRVRSQLARWAMKIARGCGAKHISRSKCTKHTSFGPLLEVEMSKKCTPLWREAHFEVKMYKTHQVRTTFGSWDVEKVHAVVARSTFRSQNVQNTPGSDHFWKLRCRKSARRCGAKHISKSKCTKHTSFGPLLEVQMSFRVAGIVDLVKSEQNVRVF